MGVASYHGIEVGEAIDLCGILVELLIKGVRYIVGGVCGNEQYTLPHS